MTKTTNFMRNMIAITICLTVTTIFSGCITINNDDKEDDDADIIAFTFNGIEGTADINKSAQTVTAKAAATVDLTAIVAEFTLSEKATATVNGVDQISKMTANNFSSPVVYKVKSKNGKTKNDWTVFISYNDDAAPQIKVTAEYGVYMGANAQVFNHLGGTIDATEGTIIAFDVTITMDKTKLTEIKFTSKFEGQPTEMTVASQTFTGLFGQEKEWTFSAPVDQNGNGEKYFTSVTHKSETLTFTGTDAKGRQVVTVVTIKTQAPDAVINPYPDGIEYALIQSTFGCQGAIPPSFYDITNGMLMGIGKARLIQGLVDFAFYEKSGVKVGCPSDAEAGDIVYAGTKMSSFSPKNTVIFAKGPAFPADKMLDVWWWMVGQDALDSSYGTHIAVASNDVIFFRKGTFVGAFKVDAIAKTGAASEITVSFINVIKIN
jgi:hypothetical protein